MAYRYDDDLDFLKKCTSEDLEDLVYCLTHDTDGKPRRTEELTSTRKYIRYSPDHKMYWEEIAAEIQCFGGNTFATLIRGGKGVFYREVLTDVCDKLKVNFNKSAKVEKIEKELLAKVLVDAIEEMKPDQLQELATSLGVKNTQGFTKQVALASFINVFNLGGFKSYQLTLMIANRVLTALIGRGLAFAGSVALSRTAAVLTGPIGWAVTGAWTAFDVAGPAYRVTIPAVIHIIALRQKVLRDSMDVEEIEFN